LNKLTKNNKIMEKKLKSDKINDLFVDFAEKSKKILPDEETDCSLLLVKDDSVRIGTYMHGRFDNLANAIIVACKNNKDLRNLILAVAGFLKQEDREGNPLEDLKAMLNDEELDENALMSIFGIGDNLVN